MENFKTESRYLKFCPEFRAFIGCMKAACYISDYQKFLMSPLIKRLGRAFISKNAAEPLKRSIGFLKHSAELLRVSDKAKSSAACLCYYTVHVVPISHSIIDHHKA